MAAKKSQKPIVLGCEVRDTVTGFRGFVITQEVRLTGNVMWGIQPPIPKGKTDIPEINVLDGHLLERIGDGVSTSLPPIDTTCTIALGEEAEDKITGYRGIVTDRVTFQNGCVYLVVQGKYSPTANKDGRPSSGAVLQHARLKRVGDGVSKDFAPQLASVPERASVQPRPPGGPMIRNAREHYRV